MTETGYVVWFICMAVAIALLLGLGTLKMSGALGRKPGERDSNVHAHPHQDRDPERHHWYDRFHHAA